MNVQENPRKSVQRNSTEDFFADVKGSPCAGFRVEGFLHAGTNCLVLGRDQGGSQKSHTTRGFGNPPCFLKMFCGRVLRMLFAASTSFGRKFFGEILLGWISTILSLSPNATPFDFVPMLGDPRECMGDVAFPPSFGPPRRQG